MEKNLDRDFLKSYYNDMVEEIGEILELVISEMPGDFQLLDTALANNDLTETAKVMHKIAPCFYNVGLPQLTQMAKGIEQDIHAGNTDNTHQAIATFKDEYYSYVPAIEAEAKRLTEREN
jgi:HPt (histidine-containing phosphotransfer) domain-containing protein